MPSDGNGNCDALSRLPIKDHTPILNDEYSAINYIDEGAIVVDANSIWVASEKCCTLRKILSYVKEGWPPKHEELTEEEARFAAKRAELTVDRHCLMRGNRVVIPSSLQSLVLQEFHESHQGMVKMKALMRSYVW